jgi:beta-glucosidase
MIKYVFVLLFLVQLVLSQGTPEERAKDLVKKMTLNEKISMVHGHSSPYAGHTTPIERIKVPSTYLEDGPQGVADGVKLVTCFPSALTIVASWDEDLMRQYGTALGKEQRLKGTNVMLGPMVNIARVAFGGRNFESFGEDPHLAAKLVVPYIQGVQSQGVIATVKHWVLNNQEFNRTSTSVNIDERTQFEIYYPPFKAAVDAGVGAVMCSYNRINSTYACENDDILNRDLKGRMGFKGWVMSDWGATHSTQQAANSGLDQQMPDETFFGEELKKAIDSGKVLASRLDDMVVRILTAMFAVGIFDTPQTGNITADVRSKEHADLARKLSEQSTVLLKNDKNILPLNADTVKSIAVIGIDGGDKTLVAGEGSGHVIPSYIVSPYNGIKSRAVKANVTYNDGSSLDQAARLAKSVNVAIVFVSTTSSEGFDRPSLNFYNDQDQLVKTIAMAQPNTIVVAHVPGSTLMPWSNLVKAIVCAFIPGQESGNAIASILFGDVNPSAKLPLTFPISDSQLPIAGNKKQYPGIDNQVDYSEKLLVGYRWYMATKNVPLFSFGHGLSYTTFQYSNLQVLASQCGGHVRILFNLKNTGSIAGAEVGQLYLNFPESAGEPPLVLRGFKKVFLNPGEQQTVEFTSLEEKKDLSIWDVTSGDWIVINGTYHVSVGSSSSDLRLFGAFLIGSGNCKR